MPYTLQAALHERMVLPNCESIPMSWMISEKDDWVPRKVAPFIWLNREPSEVASHKADTGTRQPDAIAMLKVSANHKGSISTPPDPSSRSNDDAVMNAMSTRGPNQEPATEASTSFHLETVTSDQLTRPLLSTRQFDEEGTAENAVGGSPLQALAVVPAGKQSSSSPASFGGYDLKRKGSTRAIVMGLSRRMGDKLGEKRRHIVEKMKENSAN